jgi:plasmid segregation protein ParM
MEIFALDLGNKQTKMISNKTIEKEPNGCKVFPSLFTYHEDLGSQVTMFKQKKKVEKYSTNFDPDFEYAWGKEINQIENIKFIDTMNFTNRYESHEFRLLATFALGELARDYEEAQKSILECMVVTGVPSNDFNEKEVKNIIRVLKGDHNIKINDISLNVRVKEVYVIPQPIGTIYNEILDLEGYVQNEDYFEETVTVVDIGGGTLLVDTLKDLQLDHTKREQENTGAYYLYEQIVSKAIGNNIKGLSKYLVEQIIRNADKAEGYFYKPNKNESIDITDIVKKTSIKYTREIINTINSAVKDISSIDRFVFTGGGSNLIAQEEAKKAFKYTIFVDDAETANVRGYFKYGKAIQLENKENGD